MARDARMETHRVGSSLSAEFGQVIKNFISLVTGNILVRSASFVATLVIARKLGPADFGRLSFALTVALAFSLVANLGLENLIVREVARAREGSGNLLGDILILKLFAVPLGVLLVVFFYLTDPASALLFLFLIAYSILYSYLLIVCAVFRGLEAMELQTFFLSAQMFLIAIGSIVAVEWTADPAPVAAVYLLATVAVLAGSSLLLRAKGVHPSFRWHPETVGPFLRTVLPFGLIMLGLVAHDRQPFVFVRVLGGDAPAGWYSAAYSFVAVLATIPTLLSNTLFPLLSRKAREGERGVVAINSLALKYTNALSLPLMICLFASAAYLIPLFFGAKYDEAVNLLRVLSLSLPFLFLSILFASVLQTTDWQRACAIYVWIVLGLALPTSFLLTGWGGYLAGAWAYVFGHALLTGALLRLLVQRVGRVDAQAFVRPAVAALAMGLFTYLAQSWSIFLLLPVALVIYAMMLLVSGTVGELEWMLLRSVFQNWRMGTKPAA